jgi:magnesium transporter
MVMQARLGNLLPLKNKLDSLEAHCAEIAAAINEMLHDEKEMKAMYLSRQKEQPPPLETSAKTSNLSNHTTSSEVSSHVDNSVMELELLLEDFVLRMEEMLYSLRQVQSSIKNTEEVVDIELDLMRNAIMRHELLLESYSFAASFAAAITGLFGMNLLNHMEYHKQMFYVVTVVLLFASVAIARGIQHQLRTVYVL